MQDDERSGLSRRDFLGVAAGAGLTAMVGAPTAAQAGGGHHPPVRWPIAEPYPVLNGGRFTGRPVPASQDPLVRYRWARPRADDGLQVYQLQPVAVLADTPGAFGNLRSATRGRCDISVHGAGSLRFDFGVESAAWLEFDSPDLSGAVEMSVSEYDDLARVNPGPEHPVKTLTPRRYGDTYRLELNAELFEGVRFGWIHVRAFERPFRITGVRAVCQAKPANYEGSFACSDEQLTRIWYAGAYGVRVGFLADYMAPILMDRGDRHSWAGDCNPIQAASLIAFGNWDYVRRNLDRTSDATFGIESYALYWVLSLLEYYQHSGDADALRTHSADVQAKLDHGDAIYADPDMQFFGWDERLGAGFEAPNRPETKAAYRMLLIRAAREFADAAASIGEQAVAARYRALADRRTAELRADPAWHEPLGVHALADAVNAGVVAPAEQAQIYAREFADRLDRLSFSTFNQYFIQQALTALGRIDDALVTARDNWGGQLAYGGTTYFEVFRPDWLEILGDNDPIPNSQAGWTSLSHPWGGGVTAWLTHDVLGVRPTSPGFATVDVIPRLGATLRWVEGTVPTPHGSVDVRFDADAGRGRVVVPAGATARVGVPNGGRAIRRIRVDGRTVWDDGAFRPARGVGGATATDDHVLLTGVAAGCRDVAVDYRGRRPRYVPAPIRHPMRLVARDDRTAGDWGGRYGADGHVLFSYDGEGRDRVALPGYVEAVVPWKSGQTAGWSNCRDAVWASGTSDRRALAPDADGGEPRTAGCIYSTSPDAGGMTMAVDVLAARDASYRLSMYFVDWDEKGRRQAVEVFDHETRRLLAPEQLVDDFAGGLYLVFALAGPLRLRFAHVRGDNAVLSGLFFDPLPG